MHDIAIVAAGTGLDPAGRKRRYGDERLPRHSVRSHRFPPSIGARPGVRENRRRPMPKLA